MRNLSKNEKTYVFLGVDLSTTRIKLSAWVYNESKNKAQFIITPLFYVSKGHDLILRKLKSETGKQNVYKIRVKDLPTDFFKGILKDFVNYIVEEQVKNLNGKYSDFKLKKSKPTDEVVKYTGVVYGITLDDLSENFNKMINELFLTSNKGYQLLNVDPMQFIINLEISIEESDVVGEDSDNDTEALNLTLEFSFDYIEPYSYEGGHEFHRAKLDYLKNSSTIGDLRELNRWADDSGVGTLKQSELNKAWQGKQFVNQVNNQSLDDAGQKYKDYLVKNLAFKYDIYSF